MKQDILNLTLPTLMGVEDFFVSPSNQEAFDAVDSCWHQSFFAFNIYGQKGCGKTHLAHIFKNKYHALIISAKDVNMNNFDGFLYQSKILVIEDTENLVDFEAMFHLYNTYKNEGGYILFTSIKPINQISTPLKDLNSRFGAMGAAQLKAPDDVLLSALMVKLAYDKGFELSPDVIAFILKRAERSFAYITNLISELDTLSLQRKKPVNVAMAKEVINFFEDNLQEELF